MEAAQRQFFGSGSEGVDLVALELGRSLVVVQTIARPEVFDLLRAP